MKVQKQGLKSDEIRCPECESLLIIESVDDIRISRYMKETALFLGVSKMGEIKALYVECAFCDCSIKVPNRVAVHLDLYCPIKKEYKNL